MKFSIETIKYSQIEELVSSLPAIMFIYDLHTMKYVWDNGKFKEILGCHEDEFNILIGNVRKCLLYPEDEQILDKRQAYFNNTENNIWSGVYRIKHKDGESEVKLDY